MRERASKIARIDCASGEASHRNEEDSEGRRTLGTSKRKGEGIEGMSGLLKKIATATVVTEVQGKKRI